MIDSSLDKSHNSQFNHPYGWASQQPGAQPQAVEAQAVQIPNLSHPDLDYELKA